jgi:hypothetical protein
MSKSESPAHRDLKRLALAWAQAQGYGVAAAEVSLPNYRFRLDVAAYKPHRMRTFRRSDRSNSGKLVWESTVGLTAVFECKVSKPDFRRDSRSIAATTALLKVLHERKVRIETELRLHYPSIRNGDSLFQEYYSVDFERPGHERYQRTLQDIRRLTGHLHANTKFDRLIKWGAASLLYVVADPGVVGPHEVPAGWGLLIRDGNDLRLETKPLLHEIAEPERLSLLHRISLAATRAVNREHGVTFWTRDVARGAASA